MNKYIVITILVSLVLFGCSKKNEEIIPISFSQVTLTEGFWKDRMKTEINVTVPFSVQQSEPALERFRRTANFLAGNPTQLPEPHRFMSSDLYKVMEGVAYSLMIEPNKELENFMDNAIDLIGASQEEDGYLYISHTCKNIHPEEMGEKPYSFIVHSHELYNVGHMYEAAIAYYQATGKDKLLNISIKNAKHINRVIFEGGDSKYNNGTPIMQAPGHEEIELALCKLYRVTHDKLYLDMAKKFLEIRGVTYRPQGEGVMAPTYAQQHMPVKEQTEAVGHAVRAAYLYTAMAQVDALTGHKDYEKALNSIWNDLVSTRMHITGGLGAIAGMEGFGAQYELPNLTAYNETCAAVANVFFNHAMFLSNGDAKFLDIAELSLYNNSLAGISLSGDKFFYVNPLEADGITRFNQGHGGRSEWFGCACCPPNISRLILQVPGYMYAYTGNRVYITLYGGSKTVIPLNKTSVHLEQISNYPFDGNIKVTIQPESESRFDVALRIPTWVTSDIFVPGGLYPYKNKREEHITIKINGKPIKYELEKGFAIINKIWKKGDVIDLQLPMPVRFVKSIPKVKENTERTAITRGPLVYCAEEIDNGKPTQQLFIGDTDEAQAKVSPISSEILQNIYQIETPQIKLIPYYAWCNRGDNRTMSVWISNTKPAIEKSQMEYIDNVSSVKTSSTANGDNIAIQAICDGQEAQSSSDISNKIWVSSNSDLQWIEINFKKTFIFNSLSVYWIENSKISIPQSWFIEYKNGNEWKQLQLYVTDSYQNEKDKFNVVHPANPMETNVIRMQIKPQENKVVGISEIRFE